VPLVSSSEWRPETACTESAQRHVPGQASRDESSSGDATAALPDLLQVCTVFICADSGVSTRGRLLAEHLRAGSEQQ